jgi:hypothetical protein
MKAYIVLPLTRERRITGKNPVLVEGFDRVNRSQRTRWITQTLSRLSCEPLNAIAGILPSYISIGINI